MRQFNIEAIFKQFPQLAKVRGVHNLDLHVGNVRNAVVKQFNQDLLGRIPVKHSKQDARGNFIVDTEYLLILDESGICFKQVRQKWVNEEADGMVFESRQGETLADAIADEAHNAAFMHLVIGLHEREENGNGTNESIVVYKQPKNFTVQDWVAKMQKAAEERLSADLAAIDAAGIEG